MDHKKKNIIELTRFTPAEYREQQKLPLCAVLDNLRSLSNVGAILRTADAFGLSSVLMCGITGTPPAAEIRKTALGAEESVAWEHYESTPEALRELKEQGWRICVLEQTHNSVPLQQFRPSRDEKYALVVGNEVEGVDQRVVDMADHVLEIPQVGAKHSLNVSVSAGVALWQLFKAFI